MNKEVKTMNNESKTNIDWLACNMPTHFNIYKKR